MSVACDLNGVPIVSRFGMITNTAPVTLAPPTVGAPVLISTGSPLHYAIQYTISALGDAATTGYRVRWANQARALYGATDFPRATGTVTAHLPTDGLLPGESVAVKISPLGAAGEGAGIGFSVLTAGGVIVVATQSPVIEAVAGGALRAGTAATAVSGEFSAAYASTSFVWRRYSRGVLMHEIVASTYAIPADAAGQTLELSQYIYASDGVLLAVANAESVEIGAAPVSTLNIAPPSIPLTGKIGQASAITAGTWVAGTTVTRQSRVADTVITDGLALTLTPAAGQDRASIFVREIGTKDGVTEEADSNLMAVTYFAPTFKSGGVPDFTFTKGQGAQTYDFNTRVNGEGLTWAITGTGCSIDPATGVGTFSTDMAFSDTGCVVTCYNSGSTSGVSDTFAVTVYIAAPTLSGTSIPAQSFTASATARKFAAAAAFAGEQLTYSLVSAPAWVTINATTAEVTVDTSIARSATTVTVKATNSRGEITTTVSVTVTAAVASWWPSGAKLDFDFENSRFMFNDVEYSSVNDMVIAGFYHDEAIPWVDVSSIYTAGTAVTLMGKGVTSSVADSNNRYLCCLTNGTSVADLIALRRANSTTLAAGTAVSTTVLVDITNSQPAMAATMVRMALSVNTNLSDASFMGVAGTQDTSGAIPPGLNRLYIGDRPDGLRPWGDGAELRITLIPGATNSAGLNSLSAGALIAPSLSGAAIPEQVLVRGSAGSATFQTSPAFFGTVSAYSLPGLSSDLAALISINASTGAVTPLKTTTIPRTQITVRATNSTYGYVEYSVYVSCQMAVIDPDDVTITIRHDPSSDFETAYGASAATWVFDYDPATLPETMAAFGWSGLPHVDGWTFGSGYYPTIPHPESGTDATLTNSKVARALAVGVKTGAPALQGWLVANSTTNAAWNKIGDDVTHHFIWTKDATGNLIPGPVGRVSTFAAGSATITSAAHGFTNGQIVRIVASGAGAAVPGGYAAATDYWIRNATADTYELGASATATTSISATDTGTGTQTVSCRNREWSAPSAAKVQNLQLWQPPTTGGTAVSRRMAVATKAEWDAAAPYECGDGMQQITGYAQCLTQPNYAILSQDSGSAWVTDDYFATFRTPMKRGLRKSESWGCAIDPLDWQRVFVYVGNRYGTSNCGLYFSTDFGGKFTLVLDGPVDGLSPHDRHINANGIAYAPKSIGANGNRAEKWLAILTTPFTSSSEAAADQCPGVIARSTNGGATWTSIGSWPVSRGNVYFMVGDPAVEGTFWASTATGLWKITNAFSGTFTATQLTTAANGIPTAQCPTRVVINNASTDGLFAAQSRTSAGDMTMDGGYVSANGVCYFYQARRVRLSAAAGANASVTVYGQRNGSSVSQSVTLDGTTTVATTQLFDTVTRVSVNGAVTNLKAGFDGDGFDVGIRAGGTYRSTDGGANFTRRSNDTGGDLYWISPYSPNFIVSGDDDSKSTAQVRRCTNGTSFSAPTTVEKRPGETTASQMCHPRTHGIFHRDRLQECVVIGRQSSHGPGNNHFRTTDQGSTWKINNKGYSGVKFFSPAAGCSQWSLTDDEKFCLSSYDIAAQLTLSGGRYWEDGNYDSVKAALVAAGRTEGGATPCGVVAVNPNNNVIVQAAGGYGLALFLIRSADNGANWSAVYSGTSAIGGGKAFGMLVSPATNACMWYNRRATNADWSNWSGAMSGLGSSDCVVGCTMNYSGQTTYLASNTLASISGSSAVDTVLKISRDGGDTWAAAISPGYVVTSGARTPAAAIHPSNGNVVLVRDSVKYRIRKYTLNGLTATHSATLNLLGANVTWSAATHPDFWQAPEIANICFDPRNGDVIYVTCVQTGMSNLWRSIDGGATWEALDGVAGVGMSKSITVSPRTGDVIVGSDNGKQIFEPPYKSVTFTAGNSPFSVDQTLTRGAATATVWNVVLRSGSYEAGTAEGYIILRPTISGSFAAGAATGSAGAAQTVTATIAAPAVFSLTGHGRGNGARCRLSSTGSLLTGFAAGTDYYVVNRTANTFQLAATPGGTAIAATAAGSGTMSVVFHGGANVSAINPTLTSKLDRYESYLWPRVA